MIWFQNKYKFHMEDAATSCPATVVPSAAVAAPDSSHAHCHLTLACGSLVSQRLTPTLLFLVDSGM